jgi:hypothetical protein
MSIFAGSDLLGRSMAFNATLLFTALFGLLSAITSSFVALCVTLFFLGSAVGVSVLALHSTLHPNALAGFDAHRRDVTT